MGNLSSFAKKLLRIKKEMLKLKNGNAWGKIKYPLVKTLITTANHVISSGDYVISTADYIISTAD
ncbi:MAG: hypothetical protein IJ013_06050 [Bacteroidaceae bacterium]|nr:hypothetical protein [Bacteroidaceae bacterium]